MARSQPKKLRSEGRSRPTAQDVSDPVQDVLGNNDSQNQTQRNGRDINRPEPTAGESRQSDTQRPPHTRRIPEGLLPNRSATSSFTHLRRNAISEGMSCWDYKRTTGSQSANELVQEIYNRELVARQDPAQIAVLERLKSHTEVVWDGGHADEGVGGKTVYNPNIGSGLRKGKESSDEADMIAKSRG